MRKALKIIIKQLLYYDNRKIILALPSKLMSMINNPFILYGYGV